MRNLLQTAVVAVIATAAFGGAAHAQRFSNLTGQKLVQLCTSSEPREVEGCTAYIDGIADTAAFYQRLRPSDGTKGGALPGYICVPGPTTGGQLRTAIVTWFRKHEDQANRQASGIVLRALDESYLCQGEQRRVAPSE